jgi:hypothetical protein
MAKAFGFRPRKGWERNKNAYGTKNPNGFLVYGIWGKAPNSTLREQGHFCWSVYDKCQEVFPSFTPSFQKI